jgi:hypothetical protein
MMYIAYPGLNEGVHSSVSNTYFPPCLVHNFVCVIGPSNPQYNRSVILL